MGSSFNSSDDDYFASLIDSGVVASTNPLIRLQPSSLNFTKSCIATLDTQNRNAATANTDDPDDQNIYQIGRDLLLALPTEYANATLLDTLGYWSALQRLESTRSVIDGAVVACGEQGRLAVAEEDLDFTKSCPATSHFWWRFIYSKPQEKVELNNWDLVNLFRPALPDAWAGFANATILTGVEGILEQGWINGTITTAANKCKLESCRAIDYEGNADIAGLGAIISYGCICFITTIVSALCLYFFRTTYGDINIKDKHEWAAVKVSLTYSDTVIYFTIMTSIASNVYLYSAHSIYEYMLSSLVAFMAFCAACLLALLDLYPQEPDHGFRLISRMTALSLAFSVVCPTLAKLSEFETYSIRWVDTPCYGTDMWPVTFLYIGGIATVLSWAPFAFFGLVYGLKLAYLRCISSKAEVFTPNFRRLLRITNFTGTILAFFVMWICFACIVIARNRASKMFGGSYGDDAFGYGQIIASGFCLQVVLQYLHMRFWPTLAFCASKAPIAVNAFGFNAFSRENTLQAFSSLSTVPSVEDSIDKEAAIDAKTAIHRKEKSVGVVYLSDSNAR